MIGSHYAFQKVYQLIFKCTKQSSKFKHDSGKSAVLEVFLKLCGSSIIWALLITLNWNFLIFIFSHKKVRLNYYNLSSASLVYSHRNKSKKTMFH